MGACITPATTGNMRKVLGSTDDVYKVALFLSVLAGRYLYPLATGKALGNGFWNRLQQAGLVRLGLLAGFAVPDMIDCFNGHMFDSNKTWLEHTRDRSLCITNLTCALIFFSAVGWLRASPVQNLISRVDRILKIGNVLPQIMNVCLVTWTVGSAFNLAIAKQTEDVDGTRLNTVSKWCNLVFAAACLVWKQGASPIALAGLTAGVVGMANRLAPAEDVEIARAVN